MEREARSRIFASHTGDVRESVWRLVQAEDRTLHVEQDAVYRDGAHRHRIAPINDFMRENGPPPRELQRLIDRMFDDA